MMWSDYWGALSARQRIGVGVGALLIVAGTIGLAAWLLRDPYVPLGSSLSGERLNQLAQELERAKVTYRISEGGDSVAVPQSQLGKARAAAAGGEFGVPPSVGLELFKETDFSSTDFAQRINYQRALQGELTRTIQSLAGVRSARVHVILADAGVLRRNVAKAGAAVTVSMYPGGQLTRAQVRGVQRLVAASVPEIKIDDVVVLDESGISLTRGAGDTEGDLSSVQLDLKRQADEYLEGKLVRLLEELLPRGVASVSVDTTLDYKQLRVTTEEPIPALGPTNSSHVAGVLVRERQSERKRGAGLLQSTDFVEDSPADADSTDREYEYKVGHRMEQTLSNPGSIARVSVAVALQGAPGELSTAAVEQLVAHAVGLDSSRGDSVAVVLLPALQASDAHGPGARVQSPEAKSEESGAGQPTTASHEQASTSLGTAVATIPLIAILVLILWRVQRLTRSERRSEPTSAEVDEMTAKVRQWLSEGSGNDRV